VYGIFVSSNKRQYIQIKYHILIYFIRNKNKILIRPTGEENQKAKTLPLV
jgi:hypothetical protein